MNVSWTTKHRELDGRPRRTDQTCSIDVRPDGLDLLLTLSSSSVPPSPTEDLVQDQPDRHRITDTTTALTDSDHNQQSNSAVEIY